MKKRNIALMLLLCVLIVLFSAPTVSAAQAPFSDIRTSAYYYDAVLWAVRENITAGTGNGRFSPHAHLTYAEICTFLWKYAYSPSPGNKYEISGSGKWYYKGALWCANFGIIPDDKVATKGEITKTLTRNDFVNILYKYARTWERRNMLANNVLGSYVDVPENNEDWTAWNWAVSRGIISGVTENCLAPEQSLDRAQFVTMLWRYNQYVDSPALPSDALTTGRIRGWQRLLLESGDKAKNSIWAVEKYDLDENSIPILIDCSGIIEWMFTYSGLYHAPDLDSDELWTANYFTRVFEEQNPALRDEKFKQFVNTGKIRPGDILFMRTGSGWGPYADQHMMLYIGQTADGKLVVYHSRCGANVRVDALPLGTYYLNRIYGVKRFIPAP